MIVVLLLLPASALCLMSTLIVYTADPGKPFH